MKINTLSLKENRNYFLKSIMLVAVVSLAAGFNSMAIAENTIIFKDKPSAEELGNILFPGSESITPKTRSISFSNTANTQASVEAKLEPKSESFGLLIKFALNSSDILWDSRPYLDEVGKMLKLDRLAEEKILIEGHADASGDNSYNLQLSERRAEAVKAYLIREHNVTPSRMRVAGKGEMELLSGRSPFDPLNRRVQFYRAE